NTCESWYLTLPNKVFEYLMAGVPVVASDFPVLRPFVVDEEVGLLVRPEDPDRIAEAVEGLLSRPAQLAAMRENARRLARTKCHWGTQAAVLADLYRRISSRVAPADHWAVDGAVRVNGCLPSVVRATPGR